MAQARLDEEDAVHPAALLAAVGVAVDDRGELGEALGDLPDGVLAGPLAGAPLAGRGSRSRPPWTAATTTSGLSRSSSARARKTPSSGEPGEPPDVLRLLPLRDGRGGDPDDRHLDPAQGLDHVRRERRGGPVVFAASQGKLAASRAAARLRGRS
jgi:hypothetical protein